MKWIQIYCQEKIISNRLLFNHQVQKLKFDLDALEMFPINLETLLSVS
jgi:hypothetical protein